MSSTRNRVPNRQSERIGTLEHHCASSIGVMLLINHEASTKEIIKFAYTAMYKAKETGRDKIQFYDAKA